MGYFYEGIISKIVDKTVNGRTFHSLVFMNDQGYLDKVDIKEEYLKAYSLSEGNQVKLKIGIRPRVANGNAFNSVWVIDVIL